MATKSNNHDAQYDRWGDIPGSIKVKKDNGKGQGGELAKRGKKGKKK